MDLGFLNGLMEGNMRDSGLMVLNKELAYIIQEMVSRDMVYGKMELGRDG